MNAKLADTGIDCISLPPEGKLIIGEFPLGWGYAHRPKPPRRRPRRSVAVQLTLDLDQEDKQ